MIYTMSEQPTIRLLDKHLDGLIKWERFALHLPGIEYSNIEAIKRTGRDDINDQKMALYNKWLEVNPDPTWDDVVSALETAKEISIAKKIKETFPITNSAVMSPKQSTSVEDSLSSADPVQQGEMYDMPESVVDKLKELHNTFVPLATNVKDEIESKVKEGQVTIDSLINHIDEQKAFSIEPCSSAKDSKGFFRSIQPHYNFLNPYLLVALAVQFLHPSNTAQRAEDYDEKITTFNKSTSVRSLVNTLKHYRDHLRPTTNNKVVTIRVNNCLNKEITIWVVQMLIQTLFSIKHPDEVPWYEVCQGSLVLSFIATDNMLLPFIVSCARKMEFMRLLGIVSVSIGNAYMVVNRNTEPFSLENSLIEATASGNFEAVKFLLEHLQVNANVKRNDKPVYDKFNSSLTTTMSNSKNTPFSRSVEYKKIFHELVLDIETEKKKCESEGDDNIDLRPVINSYYEQLQKQHDFLNTALLSSQSAHLSKDLQQRIKEYCEGIEEIKKEIKLDEELNQYYEQQHPNHSPSNEGHYIRVTVCVHLQWINECSLWDFEKLITFLFPSLPLTERCQCLEVEHSSKKPGGWLCNFVVEKNKKQSLLNDCKLQKDKNAEELGVFMIKVDTTVTFNYTSSNQFKSFQESFEKIKHSGDQQAIALLKEITQRQISTWDLMYTDENENQQFVPDFDSTPLMIACCNNTEKLVQLLLKYNADPNIRTKRNTTALIYSTSNATIFNMLLDHGADSGIIATSLKQTALHLACMCGNLKIVETIIKKHPTFIDMADVMGRTPLWFASEGGYLPVVERILEEKVVDINAVDHEGQTPLIVAINYSRFTVAETLLKTEGINPHIADLSGFTPLICAAFKANLQLAEKLLEMNADPNMITEHGVSALWKASSMGNMELVEKLLQAKANVNLRCTKVKAKYTTTPLYAASSEGHLDIVERLLQENANPNICGNGDIDGSTPLMGAAFNGHLEVTKRLLKAEADPNIKRRHDGETALTQACYLGHVKVVDLLLQAIKAKADPNKHKLDCETALRIACSRGHTPVVDLLLREKADPNVPDKKTLRTPLHNACSSENVSLVERLLQEPNIKLNTQDQEGNTPLLVVNRLRENYLHQNEYTDGYKIIDLLLEAQADPNIQNNYGQTALYFAVGTQNLALVEKLLKFKADPTKISFVHGKSRSPLDLAEEHLIVPRLFYRSLLKSGSPESTMQAKETFEIADQILNRLQQAKKD